MKLLSAMYCLCSAVVLAQTATGESKKSDAAPTQESAETETATVAAQAAATTPPKWYEKIKVEGIVEAYYSFRFQGAPTDRVNELRAFDVNNNTLTPSWGKIALSMAPAPAGFRIDLAFGPVADLGGPDLGTTGLNNTAAAIYRHLLQAYASAKLFDKLTIDFGKFYTSAGAEIFENSGNWLASRSMIFTYGPYTHAGLRMNYAVNDYLTIQGSIINGWDNVALSLSPKMYNVSAFLNLPTGTTVAFNFYGGPQATVNPRLLFDLVVAQTVGAFGINLNAIFGNEKDANWYAGALMAKYQFGDHVRVAGRVEYFDDTAGFRTGIANSRYLNSTLGIGYIVTNPDAFGSFEIRPEFRHDQQLGGDSSVFVGGTSTSQTTVSLTMLAWF